MTTKVRDDVRPGRDRTLDRAPTPISDGPSGLQTAQTAADAEQTASDEDQTASDADQASSATDQATADEDQRVADHDQAAADRQHAGRRVTRAAERAYQTSRDDRDADTFERHGNRLRRAETGRARDATSRLRDVGADERDAVGRQRDADVIGRIQISAEPEMSLTRQLEALIAQATADRERAAADRVRAANDRAKAARQRARLEAELEQAHLDELTGAYRRGMGRMALAHEIDRARRAGGAFVLAFVDVDRLKEVNDRSGHAAGDQVLQTVVRIIRQNLRSFDPVVRYGGDEFICGLSGASLTEARRRFATIAAGVAAETDVDVSVGLAELKATDTVERLTRRADVAMLRVKARHHARDPVPAMAPREG